MVLWSTGPGLGTALVYEVHVQPAQPPPGIGVPSDGGCAGTSALLAPRAGSSKEERAAEVRVRGGAEWEADPISSTAGGGGGDVVGDAIGAVLWAPGAGSSLSGRPARPAMQKHEQRNEV